MSRWLREALLVAGPGGRRLRLEGPAALVWTVLDEPATAQEVAARIVGRWPGAEVPDHGPVAEALELLVGSELVERLP
ncbi:MAG TPA: hypothetical protein VHK88_16290 [Aquihabitans sp.]|nr:hypothetical protein [Aquihabitans sp.]